MSQRCPCQTGGVVMSVFGVMYATDQPAAARELARVAASGARVVLASWAPGSVMPTMGQVLAAYLPPPRGGPPSRWGDPDALTALLEPCGLYLAEISTQRVTLQFPDAAAGAAFLIRTAGHVVSEQQRLSADDPGTTWAKTSCASSMSEASSRTGASISPSTTCWLRRPSRRVDVAGVSARDRSATRGLLSISSRASHRFARLAGGIRRDGT